VRLDHLLSRVSEQDPTTDPCSKSALRGEGQWLESLLASCHFSVAKV
jgi:hypothetical protein